MNTVRICKSCRQPLAPDAPEGLCPGCLVKVGLGSAASAMTEPGGSAPGAMLLDEVARLFPQLEILKLLGQGGMGVVYQARQKQLDRLVALKIMLPQFSRDPAFVERFNREARALAKLNHANIVAVYEFGQVGDAAAPLCYFIMEYVDGANLRQLLQAGGFASAEALAIVPKICEALQFAHDEGVVHRDIKPANILVDKRGRVKIADFGLAKLAGANDFSLTRSQQGMGTPQYMAPEQLEDAKSVDHRADIYSLGVVFYEMLTGELPLGRFEPPSQRVQVDVRFDEIVLKALEKRPERRYQQASQVKTQVENITGTIPAAATPVVSVANKSSSDLRATDEDGEFEPGSFVSYGLVGVLSASSASLVVNLVRGLDTQGWFANNSVAIWIVSFCGMLAVASLVYRRFFQKQGGVAARASVSDSKPLDHRVSEAVTIGLPGWFHQRARWVQTLIQGALLLTFLFGLLALLGFNLKHDTIVSAGEPAARVATTIQIGAPSPWLTVNYGGTRHGLSFYWLAPSLWMGLIGLAAAWLSETLRRSRPGFDAAADWRKQRWLVFTVVTMCVLALLLFAITVYRGGQAMEESARSVMQKATNAAPAKSNPANAP